MKRIVAIRFALAAAALSPGACRRSPAPPPQKVAASDAATNAPLAPAATLLGGERGLDHVGVAVRDLDAATRTFQSLLGFNKPQPGKLPNGIQNINYYFADGTYLETLVHWDRDKAPWLADFTDKHSGALFVVLSAHSPEASTTFLAARGVRVSTPYSGTIQTANDREMPAEKWRTFFLPEGLLPGDPLYFISYPRGNRDEFLRKLNNKNVRRLFYHDNTALGLRAVWIAVPDLAAATRAYESIGLGAGPEFDDAALLAKGRVIEAGAGQIRLLGSASPQSPVAAFLRERGRAGILGITVMAGSVPAAARLIAERTGRPMPVTEGLLGPGFRVPPELTHGVWIEFAQHLVPATAAPQ